MDEERRDWCVQRHLERAQLRKDEAARLQAYHQGQETRRRKERDLREAQWREEEERDRQALAELDARAEEEKRRHAEVMRLLEEERVAEQAARSAAKADRLAAHERMLKAHAAERAREQREWAAHQREHLRQQEHDQEEAEMLRKVQSEHAFYVQRAARLAKDLAEAEKRASRDQERSKRLDEFNRRTSELQERAAARPRPAAPAAEAEPADAASAESPPRAQSPYSSAFAARGAAAQCLLQSGRRANTVQRLANLGLLDRIDRQMAANMAGGVGAADSFGRDVEDPGYSDPLANDGTVWTDEALRQEFLRLDRDRNDRLSRTEVMRFFRERAEERGLEMRDLPSWQKIKEIICRADPMGVTGSDFSDDKLDYQEFCLLMLWLAKR
eukprot:TRINITY_DN15776_c0_g2_i1.p1 TRINITY_DN15776_c0_g2~~TRINITY_DN15776_c0_g2_i1.p1  ORF type:complete len:411 (+),score=127.03 TRINITY_DN15776_c0_g2_i1:78-1235(+)